MASEVGADRDDYDAVFVIAGELDESVDEHGTFGFVGGGAEDLLELIHHQDQTLAFAARREGRVKCVHGMFAGPEDHVAPPLAPGK